MNKWLGFSLLPHQEIQISQEHHNSQSSHGAAGGLIGNFIHSSCEEVVVSAGGTSTDDDISAAGESCFDSSTLPSLNLPPAAAAPPFSLLHHPSPFNNHSQGQYSFFIFLINFLTITTFHFACKIINFSKKQEDLNSSFKIIIKLKDGIILSVYVLLFFGFGQVPECIISAAVNADLT